MLSDSEVRLRQVVLEMFVPISRVLLESGVKPKEAVELLKAAYVHSATQDLGRSDAEASVSHVSRATSLTRREVGRLRDKYATADPDTTIEPREEGVILSHWHTDAEYLDSFGRPKPIAIGPGNATFSELVDRHCPHREVQEVLQVLVDGGYVTENDDGMLIPIRRSYSLTKGVDAAVLSLEQGIRCLAHTIYHNLHAKEGESWTQRNITMQEINSAQAPFARRAIRDRATEFSFGIDDLLAAAAKISREEADPADGQKKTIGIGLYYYEMNEDGN